jgi:hypothetical protein
MSAENNTPTLARILTETVQSGLGRMRVCLPARVLAYDASIQAVKVQPLIRELYEDEEGASQSEDLPPIHRVPVVFPGGGGFRVTFPIQVGDIVLLVFADKSIDAWLASGGTTNPAPGRSHDLADAIAIPGLHNFKTPRANAPDDTMSVGSDTGATIEFTGDEIQAGGTAALALASELNALRSAYKTHTHADPSSGSTGAPNNAGTIPSSYDGTQVLKGA